MKMRNMFAMMMNPDIKSRKTESSTPNCSSRPPSHHVGVESAYATEDPSTTRSTAGVRKSIRRPPVMNSRSILSII